MRITVYTKPQCVQCTATMRALDNAGLDYQVVDLTTDPGALDYVRDDLGHLQAPVVDTDNAGHWSGFRPDRCKSLAAA
ncbi:MAG TPA: glutaredoxin-like protein NrdH [Candidatus Dietzia merdigallinarum]|nr:glutaredoxin-like protein NrdH [Candidatus Dietzia merdigallinarum]